MIIERIGGCCQLLIELVKHTVKMQNCTILIFMLKRSKKQAIKKIDTMECSMFLSSGFAANVSHVHTYRSDADYDRFVVAGDGQDKCSSSG
jgi:hypothetical protein